MADTSALPTPRAASVILGDNVRRLRGEHTAEQLARCAQAWGLKWGTGRVAECEAGKVSATATTVYLLTLALGDLLDRPDLPPSELFAGEPLLQSTVSAQRVQRPKPPDHGAWIKEHWETLPEPLQNDPVGPYRETLAAMVEADVRIGKSLGLDRAMTARWMAHLWKHPLSVERDERAAQLPMAPATAVELIRDTEHGGYVTADGRWHVRHDPDSTCAPRSWWWVTDTATTFIDKETGEKWPRFEKFAVPNLASVRERITVRLEAEAADANRKRRGHITRELKAELQKVIADGHR